MLRQEEIPGTDPSTASQETGDAVFQPDDMAGVSDAAGRLPSVSP